MKASPHSWRQAREYPETPRMSDPVIREPEPENENDGDQIVIDVKLPETGKEAYQLFLKTSAELRWAQDPKNKRSRREILLAEKKFKIVGQHFIKLQNPLTKIANSAEQVGVALALHQSDESEYLKWKIAAQGDYVMSKLLDAYDELKLERTAYLMLYSRAKNEKTELLKILKENGNEPPNKLPVTAKGNV